ncbi:hypothetical protein BGZ58_007694 [Dissophora ornata]|nr:hypothetical protein BGZ58_007694 [Dissophora ornata]
MPLHRPDEDNYLGLAPAAERFGQILLVHEPDFNLDIDFDGHTEAAAIYTLLVISSLSIIDNGIGLMVATRRSLRLTQIAFVIWCLRFLFRMLSLVSVLFMLAVEDKFRKTHGAVSRSPLDMDMDFNSNDDSNDTINNDNYRSSQYGDSNMYNVAPPMIMVTVLEVIVAVVHGWSLLVLIRDLKNQPRPRTVIARLWAWFCRTKCGHRLGLSRFAISTASAATTSAIDYHHIAGISNSHYVGCGGGGDLESSSSRISNSSGSTGSAWDCEIAASLGLGNGLLSSASSIRSVAASMSEIMVAPGSVVAGRSRASSVSSFSSYNSYSSAEKI